MAEDTEEGEERRQVRERDHIRQGPVSHRKELGVLS